MSFLGARQHTNAAATILGAPYDATVTCRAGTALAPPAIRWASQGLETFSPFGSRDLEEIALSDAGDLDLEGCDPDALAARVREAVGRLPGLPVILGGEHTVTVGAVAAVAERHADLAVLILDAHLDLLHEYEGLRWSHATTARRISEIVGIESMAILGARSGTRAEWEESHALAGACRGAAVPRAALDRIAGRPLYLSVDIDAFDPSVAPGTGCHEPMGLTAADFLGVLRSLKGSRVVGCDVVEVSPPHDPSGQTATLAAWLVREMVLSFVP